MARHPAPTFVFADLVGFTALTQRCGDETAARVAHEFRRTMSALSREHGAWQIKSLGDGAMIWLRTRRRRWRWPRGRSRRSERARICCPCGSAPTPARRSCAAGIGMATPSTSRRAWRRGRAQRGADQPHDALGRATTTPSLRRGASTHYTGSNARSSPGGSAGGRQRPPVREGGQQSGTVQGISRYRNCVWPSIWGHGDIRPHPQARPGGMRDRGRGLEGLRQPASPRATVWARAPGAAIACGGRSRPRTRTAALSLLPHYVAQRTVAEEVREVPLP